MQSHPSIISDIPSPQTNTSCEECSPREEKIFAAPTEDSQSSNQAKEVLTGKDECIMNSHELCSYLKITPHQLYLMRRKYNLPCNKPMGKLLYFSKKEVDEWVKNNGIENIST